MAKKSSKTTRTSRIKIVSEKKRQFSTGAQRQHMQGKGMPVLVSPIAEDLLAKHCEGGVEAGYAPRNWEQGLPLSATMDSIKRHTRGEQEGLTDENHAIAAFWNWMVYLHTKEMIQRGLLPAELDDMPNYVPKVCVKHPKYKGKREPKNGCRICQMIWENNYG
ncbi:MAG: dATP/dGTP diphosphohydrolase domain-containing protein [Candidatus Heimdallarchaeaceae archaeon]